MSRLAQDFGISDVGLKKVCDRHRVPTPGRGYWAQLEAGKNPKKAVFVEVSDAALNRVKIRAGLVDLPEPVRQVIEARKAERRLTAARPRSAPQHAPTYEPVTDVHPAVRRTVLALRRGKPSDMSVATIGEGMCGVEVGCESVERAIYVLDRLARALEARGTPLVPTGRAMQVEVGADKVVFHLKERNRAVPMC